VGQLVRTRIRPVGCGAISQAKKIVSRVCRVIRRFPGSTKGPQGETLVLNVLQEALFEIVATQIRYDFLDNVTGKGRFTVFDSVARSKETLEDFALEVKSGKFADLTEAQKRGFSDLSKRGGKKGFEIKLKCP
jgi:hypothetical protein